jgi:anti-sigma regulatory factor (Ser/Thr protein kinase)
MTQNILPPSHDTRAWKNPPTASFCHEAFFYEGNDVFLNATERFVREGLAGGEAVLVVLNRSKLESLRMALGAHAASEVQFADMDEVGSNPARIIPLWRTFVDSVGPRRSSRGIGEPVSSSRTGAALVECQVHEELLNLAFDGGPTFWLLCPYDTSSLGPQVLEEARHSHPYLASSGQPTFPSTGYRPVSPTSTLRRHDLSPVPEHAICLSVTGTTIALARRNLQLQALSFGLGVSATDDLISAAHEVIANSVLHGGGRAGVSLWVEDGFMICEVTDRGLFDEPMAGRVQPSFHGMGGRGLWMANQLCDLVQLRSQMDGTVVRLHVAVDGLSRIP